MLCAPLSVIVPVGGPAGADPLGDDRAQAAALAQKISAQQIQVEALSNQYDAAQLHLGQVQAQVTAAKAQLAADSASADRVKGAVTNEAVHEYTSGGFHPPAVVSGAAVDPLVAQSYFKVATGTQTDALDRYRAAERDVADQQITLNQAEKDAASAADALAGRRQAVVVAEGQAQATLDTVNGQIASLVAAAQAAAAARLKAVQEAAYNAQVAAQQAAAAQAQAAGPAGGGSGLGLGSPSPPAAPAGSSPLAAPAGSSPVAGPASSPGVSLSVPAPTSAAGAAVAVALAQVGKPYVYGAAGPGSFDCSGLVAYAYAAAGIGLPHFTGAQWADTIQIPLTAALPGDLIFFDGLGHVGIYLGAGLMVDAPHTGALVRVEPIFGFGSIDGATRVG
ncbi:MAG: NlpC/P60 family protein [Acidimicrobiales bacterium]